MARPPATFPIVDRRRVAGRSPSSSAPVPWTAPSRPPPPPPPPPPPDSPKLHHFVVGIDLGTSTVCVGVWNKDRVDIPANALGNTVTPSYVAFTDSEMLVGDAARNYGARHPGSAVFDVRRLLGVRIDDANVQRCMKTWPFKVVEHDDGKPGVLVEFKHEEKTFTPEEITGTIIRKMMSTVEAYMGGGGGARFACDAVVTVPAGFRDEHRHAVKEAVRAAGLNVLRIINKPTAACIAYGLDRSSVPIQKALVVHLGGATLDATLFEIEEGIYEILATAGDSFGGSDFDDRLVAHFAKDFQRIHNEDIFSHPLALHQLRTACERAKRMLSVDDLATIEIDSLHNGVGFYSHITRSQFEELCDDLFQSILEPVEKVLHDAQLSRDAVDHILLVGGSSQIPKVPRLVSEFFDGKQPMECSTFGPDEAAAHGATIQASVISDRSNQGPFELLIFDVLPMSVGIETAGGVMTKLALRNMTIPIRKSAIFTTCTDNQTDMLIRVFEGDLPYARDNHHFATLLIEGIPAAPRGVPEIEIMFDQDANHVVIITAIDKTPWPWTRATSSPPSTPRAQTTLTIQPGNRMSRDAIEAMWEVLNGRSAEDAAAVDAVVREEHRLEGCAASVAAWCRAAAAAAATDDENNHPGSDYLSDPRRVALAAEADAALDWLDAATAAAVDSPPPLDADTVARRTEDLLAVAEPLVRALCGGELPQGWPDRGTDTANTAWCLTSG
ncbi:hsp70-like protein, variant 1 [Zopfochytrium polystomum]|nr:hsp70-like protein, variant 1 [Zopfochytrium polystomum]